ncbi:MAG: hypothetical protein ACOYD4_01175 [Solirubrobacterales bacterium]
MAIVTREVRGIPTEVRLGVDDGMPEECVVNLGNVRRALLGDRSPASPTPT